MDEERIKDEFSRMQITARLSRDREMISQYEAGLAFHRERVEDARYELGTLDERLWGEAMRTEEFIARLHDLQREEHEDYVAEIRGWAEEAEVKGWADSARRHREHLARLDAIKKPWEQEATA